MGAHPAQLPSRAAFCNGPYYQPFRRFIFAHAAIRHMHLFEARNKAFKDDGVLQHCADWPRFPFSE
jgi:hypothetical protein